MAFKLEKGKLQGYALVFDTDSKVMERPKDGAKFRELIKRGAVRLAPNVTATTNHDPTRLLGSTAAKTLALDYVNPVGLHCVINLPDTKDAKSLSTLIARGEPFGGSFTGEVIQWDWSRDQDGILRCEILELVVTEVTVTAVPCYEGTVSRAIMTAPGVRIAGNCPRMPTVEEIDASDDLKRRVAAMKS